MKNSRRSDRELAKALKVSQPTVSRMIKKLEKEGVIQEYTMIPNFSKLGYQIMGASFVKFGDSTEVSGELKKHTADFEQRYPHAALIGVSGTGFGKDRMFIVLYEDYAVYSEAMQLTKQLPYVNVDTLDSFLVNLTDKDQYRILSMAAISKHVLSQAEKIGKPSRGKKPVAKSKNAKRNL
jgi:DNA-binding Lrp family transcriptional regulator